MIYRTGDYWLIPARTIIGDVLWPQDQHGDPEPLSPHGVKHHYAPLASISFNSGSVTVDADLRYMLPPLGKLAAFLDVVMSVNSPDEVKIDAFKNAGL